MADPERLTIATQGGHASYHAEAACQIADPVKVDILPFDEFGEVNHAARCHFPGLGIMAIQTWAGGIEKSTRQIAEGAPAAMAPIVRRIDLEVQLALIGSCEQPVESLRRRGIHYYYQEEARLQCADWLLHHAPFLKPQRRTESTRAVQEALDKKSPDHIAIGPTFAAEKMGGFILGPERINPPGSITSFYLLQRNPRYELIPPRDDQTEWQTVLSLVHPDDEGEFEKCVDWATRLELPVTRFIPFADGSLRDHHIKHDRKGGILELACERYDERMSEFCARIEKLVSNEAVEGLFRADVFGDYPWHPEELVNPETLVD